MSGSSIALALLSGSALSAGSMPAATYDPISALARAESNQTQDIATEAAQSDVKRDTGLMKSLR